ncbi:MAG: homogentisate phytyltransferase [Saprospiraceae bacterium]|nr:homogentisate phytyltransferase [Saprospiraceae bacterium]
MFKSVRTLWRFSRPHTIIGSVISITVLWMMAIEKTEYHQQISLLLWTLIVGITCNIFIVGLNQIIDINLDKINKPELPLANGSLTIKGAYRIITICLFLTLFLSFYTSLILGWLIVLILLIGIMYSVPPVQLKKHHLPAAVAITTVRGLLVNLGMFLHFSFASGMVSVEKIRLNPFDLITYQVWMLTCFVVAFSIAIAWFKDLPDTEGDKKFRFQTLAIVYSPKMALYGGVVLVGLAYLLTIAWSFFAGNMLLSIFHLFTFVGFLANVRFVDLQKSQTITRFYMIFWLFFFLEYIYFGIDALV